MQSETGNDERSGGSAAQFADYLGIKYWTLANWIQKRRKQIGLKASLLKPGAVDSSQSHGHWVEAIVEKIPSRKRSRIRCGFILQLAPTVRSVMPEGQDLPPS
jgi:hypothetical protein